MIDVFWCVAFVSFNSTLLWSRLFSVYFYWRERKGFSGKWCKEGNGWIRRQLVFPFLFLKMNSSNIISFHLHFLTARFLKEDPEHLPSRSFGRHITWNIQTLATNKRAKFNFDEKMFKVTEGPGLSWACAWVCNPHTSDLKSAWLGPILKELNSKLNNINKFGNGNGWILFTSMMRQNDWWACAFSDLSEVDLTHTLAGREDKCHSVLSGFYISL